MAVTGDYWVGKLYDSLRRYEWERIQSREIGTVGLGSNGNKTRDNEEMSKIF
jgi:hypothetical protein